MLKKAWPIIAEVTLGQRLLLFLSKKVWTGPLAILVGSELFLRPPEPPRLGGSGSLGSGGGQMFWCMYIQ